MANTPYSLGRLKKRSEFLYVRNGRSKAVGALLVQMRKNTDETCDVRVGFTASKKVGNAVVRSRAKRHMREAARAILPLAATPGNDYVLIARASITQVTYQRLLEDLKKALNSLHTSGENNP